ncbi:hypothetical protein [Mucilaginibacter rubeus]|uniref:Uncharacterized protein n=1 Tax=Mucilaginibacter rubeus TaxID=2027860 RepID=A0A5C1I2N8_9SPHI|nr:hypothetical protein [Mucilaginibacter rubeus]QEM12024.1 hypothetical protein DEO27_018980 [Mucilaginibacter rubeus]
MKKQLKPIYFLILIAIVLLNSCKKNPVEDLKKFDNNSSKKTLGVNAITPYNFNWEVGDYMPAPTGTSILKPWASGSNQSFPLLYATDIKATDGWQLVYNTFNTTQLTPPLYFVLYNRYRGVLRAYFYLSPITPIPSSNIIHTLVQRAANNAHVLSYSAANAVDLNATSNTTSLAQPFKTTATGTWYAAEFEMAYDPNVGTKDAGSNLMSWEVNSINVSNLTLNGTSQGSITGTIAQPAPPSPGMFGSLLSGALEVGGLAALGPIKEGATSLLKSALHDALKSGLSGSVKNVSNGIFGGVAGADSTRQYVHLTTNTTYTFTGASTDVYSLANMSMIIPGSKNQESTTGYVPLYPSPLGLMTLSAAPTAQLVYLQYSWGHFPVAQLNPNSYNIVWNQSIINNTSTGATIANLKQEIISYENTNDDGTDQPWPVGSEYDGANRYVNLGYPSPSNNNYFAIRTVNTCYGCDFSNSEAWATFTIGQKMPNHVLRISFDVVPNNGTPKIKIVKSFNITLSGVTTIDG